MRNSVPEAPLRDCREVWSLRQAELWWAVEHNGRELSVESVFPS